MDKALVYSMVSKNIFNKKKHIKYYLTTFIGVKLDSHKWFRIAPFHVALNRLSVSYLGSESDETPAGPTRIRC